MPATQSSCRALAGAKKGLLYSSVFLVLLSHGRHWWSLTDIEPTSNVSQALRDRVNDSTLFPMPLQNLTWMTDNFLLWIAAGYCCS